MNERQGKQSRGLRLIPLPSRAAQITYRLADPEGQGEGVVETVLICHPDSQRHTICVSSQLGCAMNCHFCFTAK